MIRFLWKVIRSVATNGRGGSGGFVSELSDQAGGGAGITAGFAIVITAEA